MSGVRLDVRRMLLARGWKEDRDRGCVLRLGTALYASWGSDSGVDGRQGRRRAKYSVSFTGDVPASVIVATCEAVAKADAR